MFKPESPFRADRAPQEPVRIPQDLIDRLFLEMSLDLPGEDRVDNIEPLIRFLAARKGLRTDRIQRLPHGRFLVEKDAGSTPIKIWTEEIALEDGGISVHIEARAQPSPDFESPLDEPFSWSEGIRMNASPAARQAHRKWQEETQRKREAEEAEARRTRARLLPGAVAFMKSLDEYGDTLPPAQLGALGNYLTEALGWEMEPTDLVRIGNVSDGCWHVSLVRDGTEWNIAQIDAP